MTEIDMSFQGQRRRSVASELSSKCVCVCVCVPHVLVVVFCNIASVR